MTDPVQPEPIVVNATPTADQIAAALRQLVLVLATAATALGAVGWAGELNALAIVAGPLAGLIVIVWGQFATRKAAQIKATLATALPDSVATTKP